MCGQLLRDKRFFDSYTRVGKTEYATARSTWTNTSGSTLFQNKSQGKGKNDVPNHHYLPQNNSYFCSTHL